MITSTIQKYAQSCASRLRGRNLALSSTPRSAHQMQKPNTIMWFTAIIIISQYGYTKTLTCDLMMEPVDFQSSTVFKTRVIGLRLPMNKHWTEPPNCKTSVPL